MLSSTGLRLSVRHWLTSCKLCVVLNFNFRKEPVNVGSSGPICPLGVQAPYNGISWHAAFVLLFATIACSGKLSASVDSH